MRRQGMYEEPCAAHQPWKGLHGLYLSKVLTVDAETGTVGVELSEGSQPVPASVLAMNASASNGFIWLPQVEDLVVVGFLDAHSSMPVVLGSLYATNDTLHSVNPGDLTIKHSSGSSVVIGEDGAITVTQAGGSTLRMDEDNVTITHAGSSVDIDENGLLVATGPNGQKASLLNAEMKLEAGSAMIQVLHNSGIILTPGGAGVINLGGSTPLMRAGDSTSGPIGVVAPHTHTLVGGSSIVLGG